MQVLTAQQYAQRLMTSSYSDGITRTMRPGSDGAISVNLADLTAQEKWLARAAMQEIGDMTGLQFRETTGAAMITYSNDGSGASTRTAASGTTINSATVRISSDRVGDSDGYGSFAFRTYMHETLHALGLGHPQDYGEIQDFSRSAIANDSWQISLMSYFDQDENSWVNATKAYHLTPMLADYLALTQMYGSTPIHGWNTTYGVNSNAGGALDAAASLGAGATFLIVDTGGIDHVNFVGSSVAQKIDLTPGAISSVMGAVGNMQIAPGTQIEHATGGQAADTLIGNAAGNRLTGNAGNDQIAAGDGADTVWGGAGDDFISGGGDADLLAGGSGHETIWAGAGADSVSGDAGFDLMGGGSGNDTVSGGLGNDTIWGGLDHDNLDGGDGADVIGAGAGNDVVTGGQGSNTVYGALGADRITAGEGHDLIFGGDGSDAIVAGGGDDTVWGGNGDDNIVGGAGGDRLAGGTGNDILQGGGGADRFVFTSGFDAIRDFEAAADIITLTSFAGLESWADVQARLVQVQSHVEFRQDGHALRIETVQLADLEADNFVW